MKLFLKKLQFIELFLITLPVIAGLVVILFEVCIFYMLPEPKSLHYNNWYILGLMIFAVTAHSLCVFDLFINKLKLSKEKAYLFTFVLLFINIVYLTLFIPTANLDIFFQEIFLVSTIIVFTLTYFTTLIFFNVLKKF